MRYLKICFKLLLSFSICFTFGISIASCRKPTTKEILRAGIDSVNEACSVEWLNEKECSYVLEGFNAANAIDDRDNKKLALVAARILKNVEVDHPSEKAKPYLDWAIIALNAIANS